MDRDPSRAHAAVMLKARLALLLTIANLLPALAWFGLRHIPPLRTLPEETVQIGSRFAPSPVRFARREIGPFPAWHPQITNIQVLNFD